MGKIMPILMIIFGLFISGFYWHIWDDSIVYIDDYIINDVYYTMIRFVWDIIPVIILFAGIIWLVAQGVSSKGDEAE